MVEIKEVRAAKHKIFFVMVARKYFQCSLAPSISATTATISHRDLKPENLLLNEGGNLKVSNLGLSALPEHYLNDGLLQTQCETPAYVAPEVLRKKRLRRAQADIWSCGVILANAFKFISSMLSGFDLLNLFENGRRSGSLFTSRCSAVAVVSILSET